MENLKRWIPNTEVPADLIPISTSRNADFVIFYFKEKAEEKKIAISFATEDVIGYRETDEGSFLKSYNALLEHYGAEFVQSWTLFRVGNSDYLRWVKEQSIGVYNSTKFNYYAFITYYVTTEVISLSEPKVEVQNQGE